MKGLAPLKDKAQREERRLLRGRLRLLATVSVLSVILPCLLTFSMPHTTFVVVSESMMPTLNPGDLLLTHPVNGEIPNGTIVVFKSPLGGYETHRIIGRVRTEGGICYLTQGDANSQSDSFLLPEERVVGAPYLIIPKLGLYFLIPKEVTLIVTLTLTGTYLVLVSRSVNTPTMQNPASHPSKDEGKRRIRVSGASACFLVGTLLLSSVVFAHSSIYLIYPNSGKTVSVASPSILLQQGNTGSSTIYDNGNRANVTVDTPSKGKLKTYDYVLKVANQGTSQWLLTLSKSSDGDIVRLKNATIWFHDGSGISRQIQLIDGSYAQTSGSPYSLPVGGTVYIAMAVSSSSSGASTIVAKLKATVPSSGVSEELTITFNIA